MSNSTRPVFVIGCHRSGTTLVRYILDAHPRLACPPESKFIAGLARAFNYPQALTGLRSLGVSPQQYLDKLRVLIDCIFDGYARSFGKARWIDKTPNYTGILDFLDRLYSHDAIYVLVVRHPLDCVDSLMRMAAFGTDAPEDPDIASTVARYGRGRLAWAQHWRDVHVRLASFHADAGDRCLVVSYEKLVQEPHMQVEALLDFLGEPTVPGLLDKAFSGDHSSGYQDGSIQHSGGIHAHSVARWRRWDQQDITDVWKVVAASAGPFGYERLMTDAEDHAHLPSSTGGDLSSRS